MDAFEKIKFCGNVPEKDLCKTVCDNEIISRPDQLFSPLKEKIKYNINKKYTHRRQARFPDHEIYFKLLPSSKMTDCRPTSASLNKYLADPLKALSPIYSKPL